MNFTDAIKSCFQQYATFSGRASRSEYWWFALFSVLVTLAARYLFDEPVDARHWLGILLIGGGVALLGGQA